MDKSLQSKLSMIDFVFVMFLYSGVLDVTLFVAFDDLDFFSRKFSCFKSLCANGLIWASSACIYYLNWLRQWQTHFLFSSPFNILVLFHFALIISKAETLLLTSSTMLTEKNAALLELWVFTAEQTAVVFALF